MSEISPAMWLALNVAITFVNVEIHISEALIASLLEIVATLLIFVAAALRQK